ncbi:MAG: BACON domain-containing protein, partial [bacterium]|nr:BACON domain-containing protein [bacterium]
TVTLINTPELEVNREKLNFASNDSTTTGTQYLLVSNVGGGVLNWSAVSDSSWLSVSPASGTGDGKPGVSVDATGLDEGTYNGTVTFSGSGSVSVAVTLTVSSSFTAAPLGVFETPLDNSTVSGSIPVTGWVLDDIETDTVKIYRDPVSGEGSDLVFISDAIFVEGARPDIETMYPDYPFNYQAGWGCMVLTNFLPNDGNGTFTLYAKAGDTDGNTTTLGSKTIIVDNENAVKPFGAIDTPTQGGSASGSSFVNWGWALTPQPNTIPTDSSTIYVWVDGVSLGNPVYNLYREDVATYFPGYNNSNGAVGYFHLDTAAFSSGIHTIQWSATDDAGNTDGIGSRFFSILHTGADSLLSVQGSKSRFKGKLGSAAVFPGDILVNKDFNRQNSLLPMKTNGKNTVRLKELELVEILFGGQFTALQGYLQTSTGKFQALPVGSHLDVKRGAFTWSPGPGQFATYKLVFLLTDSAGNLSRRTVTFVMEPKFNVQVKEFNEDNEFKGIINK